MGAFAINLSVILNSQLLFDPYGKRGFSESDFIDGLHLELIDFEPKANCTNVMY